MSSPVATPVAVADLIEIPSAIQAVFDEHDDPTHASTKDLNGQLSPILALVSLVQKQMIEHKAVLDAAELSEHTNLLDPKFEMLRQTIHAWEREVNAVAEHARNAVKCGAQWDRYMGEARVDVVNILTLARDMAAPVVIAEPPVAATPVTP